MSQEESTSPEPLAGADGPKRECEQQEANVWSTREHSGFALQVRGEMQRTAPNRALSNVLTMFREGVPTGSPECNQLAAFANSSTCHISSSFK